MLFQLTPEIKNYEWGSIGQLSEFLGLSPSGLPEAEAWFGSHPFSGTAVQVGRRVLSFNEWLSGRDSSFDLLVKLLSASRPLSIQVHPNERDAQLGFDLENLNAIPLDSPGRVYRDPRPKPELIVALSSSFRALIGFVNNDKLTERLRILLSGGALPSSLGNGGGLVLTLRAFVEWVLAESPEVLKASMAVGEWIEAGPVWPESGTAGMDPQTLKKIQQWHPGDPGLLLAIAMHHVTLEVGTGLYVAPGVAHAYVEGRGLELMLPSDNVLRAGLTAKPRNPEGFLQATSLVGTASPRIVLPDLVGNIFRYRHASMPFDLSQIVGDSGIFTLKQDSLIVVEAGQVLAGQTNNLQKLTRGEVYFAERSDLVLSSDPTARAWIATSRMCRSV